MSLMKDTFDTMALINSELNQSEMNMDMAMDPLLNMNMDMYFNQDMFDMNAFPADFEFRIDEATPLASPCKTNQPSFIKVPMYNFDMAYTHSPLGSPLNELQQNMLFFNSATTSPTYNGWSPDFYEGRRASTPACFTEFVHASRNSAPSDEKPAPRRASVSSGRRRSISKPDSPTKVYNCGEEGCTKIFKRSEHLKRHMKSIHSTEKPFACPCCDKRFSRADNLSQHLRIHRDPTDKLRTKGFTSNTPYVLPINSPLEDQLNFTSLSL